MTSQSSLESFTYFEKMVTQPTWKEVLLNLIATNRIDPWNMDIGKLADAFVAHVKALEKVNFVVEANIILAASILLRYKSDQLKAFAYPPEPVQETLETYIPEDGPQDVIPVLTLASRIPPKRPVTLNELLNEMEKIIKYDDVERIKIPRGSIEEIVDFEVNDRDIDGDMNRTYQNALNMTDSEGWTMFSRLTGAMNVTSRVYTLILLLYLVQENMIDLRQDEMFGEIFIKCLNTKGANVL